MRYAGSGARDEDVGARFAQASASNVATPTSGMSSPNANPFAVLTPIRSPVYEPGPFETATAPISPL